MTYGIKKFNHIAPPQTFRIAGMASAGTKAAQLRIAVVSEDQSAQSTWRRACQQREDIYRAFLKGLD